MKKKFLLLILVFFATQLLAIEASKKVLISQVLEHPALDLTAKGIIEGLAQNGYKRGVNLQLRIESAQNNPALAAQIAAKFTNQSPDVVVGLGTLCAQSFLQYTRNNKVKMIFSSVTDPLQAGLVKSLKEPGYQTSGVSNFVALEPQINLFLKIQPELKRLGILYNPSEVNSVSIVNGLEELCPKLGIKLLKQTLSKTAEAAQTATKLASLVDAIFISNDNTALGALQTIIMAANKVHIPVYVSDTDAVTGGALAALGPNQYQIGLQTGKMIARYLNGTDLSTLAVEFPTQMDLYLNETAAQMTGITFNKDLLLRATKIINKSSS